MKTRFSFCALVALLITCAAPQLQAQVFYLALPTQATGQNYNVSVGVGPSGSATLIKSTVANMPSWPGWGIGLENGANLTLDGSNVTATSNSGVGSLYSGTNNSVTLKNNSVINSGPTGAGVMLLAGSSFAMDSSHITASQYGVMLSGGSVSAVVANGSTIQSGNFCDSVYLAGANSRLTVSGGSILNGLTRINGDNGLLSVSNSTVNGTVGIIGNYSKITFDTAHAQYLYSSGLGNQIDLTNSQVVSASGYAVNVPSNGSGLVSSGLLFKAAGSNINGGTGYGIYNLSDNARFSITAGSNVAGGSGAFYSTGANGQVSIADSTIGTLNVMVSSPGATGTNLQLQRANTGDIYITDNHASVVSTNSTTSGIIELFGSAEQIAVNGGQVTNGIVTIATVAGASSAISVSNANVSGRGCRLELVRGGEP